MVIVLMVIIVILMVIPSFLSFLSFLKFKAIIKQPFMVFIQQRLISFLCIKYQYLALNIP